MHEAKRSLDDVVAVFHRVPGKRLHAVFPAVYNIITRDVEAKIRAPADAAAPPFFREPQWISHLSGMFAALYFEALQDHLTGYKTARTSPFSDAWRMTFDYNTKKNAVPVLAALLGINAHIKFDLARGLANNFANHPRIGDRTISDNNIKADHDAVNGILEGAMPAIFRALRYEYACPVSFGMEDFDAPTQSAMLHRLGAWREEVWGDMQELRKGPAAAKLKSDEMNAKSKAGAELFLRGTALFTEGAELFVEFARWLGDRL